MPPLALVGRIGTAEIPGELPPQPGGVERSRRVATPLEPHDPAVAPRPGVRLLLHDRDAARATPRVEGDSGDHALAAVEQLVKLVAPRRKQAGAFLSPVRPRRGRGGHPGRPPRAD